jgi:ABC-2 type transport system permease protein
MNIIKRELRANRKALIIWSICMALLVLSGMSKYSAYTSGGATSDVFNNMPYSIKAIFGFGSFDVTTMSGFYAFLFTYIQLTVGIHAILLGSGIIAKEERDKTTEFLIAKPVSRTIIITSKLMAALINIVIINIVSFVSSVLMVDSLNKGESIVKELIILHISMLMMQLIFLSLGFFISALIRKSKSSGSMATGIILGAYVVSKITDLTDKVNFINVLTPFKYFNLVDIINKNSLNVVVIILTIILISILILSTYYFYNQRDMGV